MKGYVVVDVVHSRDRIRRAEVLWLYYCLRLRSAASNLAWVVDGGKVERAPMK